VNSLVNDSSGTMHNGEVSVHGELHTVLEITNFNVEAGKSDGCCDGWHNDDDFTLRVL